MIRRAPAWALLAALALSSWAPTAAAYFEDTAVDSRTIAMGASAMAVTTRSSAYYWNPAGLAELQKLEVIADYAKPYSITDLNAGAIMVGWRAFETGFAVAWHRLAITDVYAEDQFDLAAGRVLAEPLPGHALAAGATLKIGRIGFQKFADPVTGNDVDFGSITRASIDLGLRWATPWNVDFAWMTRDLLEPNYEFVSGSGGGTLPRRYEAAVAYRWHPESTITAGWTELDAGGRSSLNLGIEIWFYDVFAIRSGFTNAANIYGATDPPTNFHFTGGFGIQERGWEIDAAAFTNHDLGASYRLSLLIPVGKAP